MWLEGGGIIFSAEAQMYLLTNSNMLMSHFNPQIIIFVQQNLFLLSFAGFVSINVIFYRK